MATTTLQSTGKDLLINNMLASSGASIQADYEENNPKSSSYIKNRPFYTGYVTQKIKGYIPKNPEGCYHYFPIFTDEGMTEAVNLESIIADDRKKYLLNGEEANIFISTLKEDFQGLESYSFKIDYHKGWEDTEISGPYVIIKNTDKIDLDNLNEFIISYQQMSIKKLDAKYLPDMSEISEEVEKKLDIVIQSTVWSDF